MKNRNEHIFILAALYFIFESRFFCILNVIFIYIFFVFILLLMFVLNVTILLCFCMELYFFSWQHFVDGTKKKVLNCSMVFGFFLYSFAISVPFFRELNKWRQNDGISCSNKQYILINITKTITFIFAWCDGKKEKNNEVLILCRH